MDQKTALSTTQSEILRLNAELEKSKYAATDLKARFLDATKKQKETLDNTDVRVHHAETELALLRSKADGWLAELTGLNRDLNSKFYRDIFLLLSFFTAITLMIWPLDNSSF